MSPGGRWSVDPGWRSGRSPATPERLRKRQSTPQRPTLQHRTRILSHFVCARTEKWRISRAFCVRGCWRSILQAPLHPGDLHASLRLGHVGRRWGGVGGIRRRASFTRRAAPGAARRRRAAARRARAGARRRAGSSGAARAASSLRWAARSDRASAAWALRVVPSGAPCRSARRSAAVSCGMPDGRAASLELVEGGFGGLAERAAGGGASQLGGEDAGVAPTDLGERPPRREPGGDRDPQQIEHVGQLGLDRLLALLRSLAERGLRRRDSRRRERRGRRRCRAGREPR